MWKYPQKESLTEAQKQEKEMSKAGGVQDSDLTFDEMMRARAYFLKHTEECITNPFDLRTVLSEMGQYPPEFELLYCMEQLSNKMSFNDFCNYLQYLKKNFMRPEPRDVDTLRAFVALGGSQDRRGQVNTDNLRTTIRHFDLTIDIDAMIRLADEDGSGFIDFGEFKHMWRETPPPVDAEKREEEEEENAPLEEEANESNTAVLKSYLFPKIVGSQAPSQHKQGKRRTLTVVNQRLPPIQQASALLLQAAAVPGAESDSDADDDKFPQPKFTTGGYKPPSPVILSLRHLKPAKLKMLSQSFTPRKPGSPRHTPRSARGGSKSPRVQQPAAPRSPRK